MRSKEIGLPLVVAVAVTRGMLGAGVGLLLADRLARTRRLKVGRALVTIGAITTVPLLAAIIRRRA